MIKFGNHKLGDNIAIFSMGPARSCPSKSKGLCKVVERGFRCYADKAELIYPAVLPARIKQGKEWIATPKEKLLEDFKTKIQARRKNTNYLRYNESGDFYDQEDIEKLSFIAEGLKKIGITTYGFTARSDLDFSKAKFIVRGSGWKAKNGKSVVLQKGEKTPKGFVLCPGGKKSCGGVGCNICKVEDKINIAFHKH